MIVITERKVNPALAKTKAFFKYSLEIKRVRVPLIMVIDKDMETGIIRPMDEESCETP